MCAIFMELLMAARRLLAISATLLLKIMLIAIHLLTKSSYKRSFLSLALN